MTDGRTGQRPVLIVVQAFKGTLSAGQVARAAGAGARAAGVAPDVLTGSDGGDGLLEALAPWLGRWTEHSAPDSLGREVPVRVGWFDDGAAVVESSGVIGLRLLGEDERRPLEASTRGLGVVLAAVQRAGADRIVVGLGGSATVDGGLGMARAWGWQALDRRAREISEGGGGLVELERLIAGVPPAAAVLGLCDVSNPMLGPNGAAPVYGPQKGASPRDVQRLALGLRRLVASEPSGHFATLAARPGAGAAGGLGFGLLAFAAGELTPGAEWVLERHEFRARLKRACGVIVAEAAFDRTSTSGKLTGVVLARARDAGLPIVLLSPRAANPPPGVMVETGGGLWDERVLEQRAAAGARQLVRLLGS